MVDLATQKLDEDFVSSQNELEKDSVVESIGKVCDFLQLSSVVSRLTSVIVVWGGKVGLRYPWPDSLTSLLLSGFLRLPG